jgi:hypothetical protein
MGYQSTIYKIRMSIGLTAWDFKEEESTLKKPGNLDPIGMRKQEEAQSEHVVSLTSVVHVSQSLSSLRCVLWAIYQKNVLDTLCKG